MERVLPSTKRLRLRQWTESDLVPFAAMNADPEVMEYFPSLLNRKESDAFAERTREHIETHGWGLWAVEQRSDQCFIGFIGLHPARPELPFSPVIEIGWRLARDYWGIGYATEAASECLRFAFEDLDLPGIVSFTSSLNERSIAVMRRIGLSNRARDFDHPLIPADHRLRRHVLYGISISEFQMASGSEQANGHDPPARRELKAE